MFHSLLTKQQPYPQGFLFRFVGLLFAAFDLPYIYASPLDVFTEAIARPFIVLTEAMASPFFVFTLAGPDAPAAKRVNVPLDVNFTHVSDPLVPVALPPVCPPAKSAVVYMMITIPEPPFPPSVPLPTPPPPPPPPPPVFAVPAPPLAPVPVFP